MSAPLPLTLTVLYYKRSSKIHKTGKADGRLVLSSNGSISLYDDDDDKNSKAIYTGIHKDIVKRQLVDDDVLLLGPWECQILSTAAATTANAVKPKRTPLLPLRSGKAMKRTMAHQRPLVSKLVKTSLATSNGGVKSSRSEVDESSEDESDNEPPVATAAAIPKSLIRKGPFQTGIRSSKPLVNTHSIASTSNGEFPGAVGQLQIPSQILKVLRPHQRSGIAFLWNCVTGNQAGIREIYSKEEEEVPRGVVLADEMGLGKVSITFFVLFQCPLY
jgi:hypothetical protein